MEKCKTKTNQANLNIFMHIPAFLGIFRCIQAYSGVIRLQNQAPSQTSKIRSKLIIKTPE